ncbi:hypothetical protein D3C75_1154570 [compost metagenome]
MRVQRPFFRILGANCLSFRASGDLHGIQFGGVAFAETQFRIVLCPPKVPAYRAIGPP